MLTPRRTGRFVWVALVAGALAFAPSVALGQAQATTGIIRGSVTDQAGQPIAGATVLAKNTETNIERTATTNGNGVYVISLLQIGRYDVTARFVGYQAIRRQNVSVRLGEAADVSFQLEQVAVELEEITVVADDPIIDATQVAQTTRLPEEVVEGLPNDGRNFINLTKLTPGVAVVQGPDGDVLSVAGQRGIHNNVSVDGADFNNPFFGEQRGGQRPAFTFNLDAIEDMVVVAQGANAEFGRSSGGFVNVVTKSGTNELKGSVHYYGKFDALSSDFKSQGVFNGFEPDFAQSQFGATLGGPLIRDKVFFFAAYDQQIRSETKQKDRLGLIDPALVAWSDTAFSGVLNGDFGPIRRTNDAEALLLKLDGSLGSRNFWSLKYNYTNSSQENGTNDADIWGRSSNGLEDDFSHAINGSLTSVLSATTTNEFRFQWAREDRPRFYRGPINPSTSRPFPDTDVSFTGYRLGMPFFLPVDAYDWRFQILDNVSFVQGDHLFKVGAEWNRVEANQTFVGFANGRMAFTSTQGFLNYQTQGNTYIECSDGSSGRTDMGFSCPVGETITGPVALYLQFAGVGGLTAEQAGTQKIVQHDIALFAQDSWRPRPDLTIDYGLRWEAQIQPDPITPASDVFYSPFIGQTVTNSTGSYLFPSDGNIPSDKSMFQPRLGITWDVNNDGRSVLRASGGLYYSRLAMLNFASIRSTNGSIGQTLYRDSELTGILGPPPAYGDLLPDPGPSAVPFQPGVFVADRDLKNPRTFSASASWEQAFGQDFAGLVTYTFAKTDNLSRFVDRNDAVFGSPWADFGAVDPTLAGNGLGSLTVLESSAKSRYHGVTLGLKRNNPNLGFEVNYTLSWDKSDDDNERDPFSFRYAQADRLDREYNWSDRDQRHRLNAWLFARIPTAEIYLNNRISYYSAQPVSEQCGSNNQGTGQRAVSPQDRICPDGSILLRNTLRKDNEFFTWDLRLTRPFRLFNGQLDLIVDIFNITNNSNFKDPTTGGFFLNFDGTFQSGLGTPRQVQVGTRYSF